MAKDPIKKAENGTYYFRANLGYHPVTGKQIQKYRSGFSTKKEARAEYSKLILASTEELADKKEDITFKKFIEEIYLPWYKTQVKESTYKNRYSTIQKHFAYFYKKKVSEIEAINVQTWQLKLAKQFSPNYVRIVQGMLCLAFDRAIILGLAKKNPARMIGNIKSKKVKIDFWTLEELQKVISLLYKGDYYEHYLFISFWLLFMTGMRIGEAAALQWDDIDFETGMLQKRKEERIQLAVQADEPTLNIQIWKAYTDEVEISFVSPAGTRIGPIQSVLGSQRFRIGETEILLYYGKPSPYNVAQEIYIDMIPVTDYITSGVWQIILNPTRVVEGQYDLWLPSENVLNRGTGFLYPDEEVTLTIPSTADKVISVGAYDALTFSYASFSGRGYTWQDERTKPDLVAPGVNVRTTAVGGGVTVVSGTSFATPFVTGASALLMEWGIVRGNDPFLYGEKVKAYLRRGARELPGFGKYPNREVGYGRLCLERSLPD